MSNEFSIFTRFNSIDPLYSTLDSALQQSNLSACPAYSGLADFGLYFVDEKHLVGI